MRKSTLINEFKRFLAQSPTQYHATQNMVESLQSEGFNELKEGDVWKLKRNGKYFVNRGGGALVAFRMGVKSPVETGARIIGTHTDSPCLKIKASPDIKTKNYITLGVEVYGGPILQTWFDRDLSIAGRVSFVGKNNTLQSRLIDFKRPIAVIPNLAIHLSPKTADKTGINRQQELPPLFAQIPKGDSSFEFKMILKDEIKKTDPRLTVKEVLDFDLSFYDTQAPTLLGFHNEFLTGGRIDNLISCFVGLKTLLEAESDHLLVLVCNDHEEIGSQSALGAAGPFFETVLNRIIQKQEDFYRTLSKSTLISVDNAHGIHPNYASQSDTNHAPLLNGGPAIKINANQRYATNSETASLFRYICQQSKIPAQTYINHSNLACGSTIGPITSTKTGIQTLDIGIPTFAMHSIRETCGTEDIWLLQKALEQFYIFQP